MTDAPIRVLIADDHPVVREGLRSFLSSRPGIEVVGEAGDRDSTVTAARVLEPDVVLVDLMMPGDGVETIHRLQALDPTPRAIVLTSFTGEDMVLPALRAGAAGYLLKDVHPRELESAIRTVHEGRSLLSPAVTSTVIGAATAPHSEVDPIAELTPREREVLGLLGRGLSNKQLAAELYLSEKTVKTHVSSILSKLHLADRTQAALLAARHGLT